MKYDIVFWTFGNIDAERFIPLLVELNQRKIKTLLFYQDYNYKYGLSSINLELIEKFEVDVMDYSFFLKNNIFLRAADFFADIFKRKSVLKIIHNKFRGLCSKIVERTIDKSLAGKILDTLDPGINIFCFVYIVKESRYPYGGYFLRKISRERGIPCFALKGGTTTSPVDKSGPKGVADFDKYYVPNEREKEKAQFKHKGGNPDVLTFGDPRFDTKWKSAVNGVFAQKIKAKLDGLEIRGKFKVVYLMPNFECCNILSQKTKNMGSIIDALKELDDAFLLIKPHPRYRAEGEIRAIAAKHDFRDFCILDDDPLLCYMEHVDLVISSFTSALNDTLPEWHDKVLIYDDFSKDAGIDNFFRDIFPFAESPEELLKFLKIKEKTGIGTNNGACSSNKKIDDFFRKWVAGGNEPDSIITNTVDHICGELNRTKVMSNNDLLGESSGHVSDD
jgi:hypothetical protein